MRLQETELRGAWLVESVPIWDERGFFSRVFCTREFGERGLETRFEQHSISYSRLRGTLRGLHFQIEPFSEVKIVSCLKGAIWDVIVDLRAGSTSYLKWFGAELNEDNRLMMYVPRGFGHGFIALTDNVETLYLNSAIYAPETERGLRWNDPAVRIEWPLQPGKMSNKDRKWPDLNPEFHGVESMRGFL